jgi:hypothetical protein
VRPPQGVWPKRHDLPLFLLVGFLTVPASRAGVFLNLEPLVGALLGVLVLGDAWGAGTVAGGALIVGAAVVISHKRGALSGTGTSRQDCDRCAGNPTNAWDVGPTPSSNSATRSSRPAPSSRPRTSEPPSGPPARVVQRLCGPDTLGGLDEEA